METGSEEVPEDCIDKYGGTLKYLSRPHGMVEFASRGTECEERKEPCPGESAALRGLGADSPPVASPDPYARGNLKKMQLTSVTRS